MANRDDQYFLAAHTVINPIGKPLHCADPDIPAFTSRCIGVIGDEAVGTSHLVDQRTPQATLFGLVISGGGSQILLGLVEDANARHFS